MGDINLGCSLHQMFQRAVAVTMIGSFGRDRKHPQWELKLFRSLLQKREGEVGEVIFYPERDTTYILLGGGAIGKRICLHDICIRNVVDFHHFGVRKAKFYQLPRFGYQKHINCVRSGLFFRYYGIYVKQTQ